MAIFTFRNFPSPTMLLVFFGYFCSRRRAMVNKLWCRELARKWFHTKFEPPQARCFSEPKSQDKVLAWYLLYRWLIFLLWFTIVICSLLAVGSAAPLSAKWEMWPIYLTNWDLALGLSQSLIGAILVTNRWKLQQKPDFDPCNLHYGKLEKVYWFMYIVTSSLALGVTVTYWALVHDPKIHHVDIINLLVHVANSVLMMIDFCIAGIPFELRCFWWCPLVVSFYVIFTLIYYAAGGLDRRGLPRIYDILDWEKPGRTLIVCVGGLTFLVITHCLLYFLARFRNRTYEKRWKIAMVMAGKDLDKEETARRKNDSYV